jgi:hypothetical protein
VAACVELVPDQSPRAASSRATTASHRW